MGENTRSPAIPASLKAPVEEADAPERWSAQRKMELLLRRREALEDLSPASQVPAHVLECWQRRFLEVGTKGLESHREPEERGVGPGPGEDRRTDDVLRTCRGPARKKRLRDRVKEPLTKRIQISPGTGRGFLVKMIYEV